MTVDIIEAIENAVPGITDGVNRLQAASWVDPLKHETEIWLGGFNITHVEVTPVWNTDGGDVGRLIINALSDEGIIAQASLTVDRESGRGTFGGWKIVRQRTITALEWKEHRRPYGQVPQVIATFEHLADPVLIPGEADSPIELERVTEIFRSLRDSWIDTGHSESAAAND